MIPMWEGNQKFGHPKTHWFLWAPDGLWIHTFHWPKDVGALGLWPWRYTSAARRGIAMGLDLVIPGAKKTIGTK